MRKIYSLLLLGGLLLLGAGNLKAAIYFVNNSSWSSVYCYAWNGSGNNGEFPGQEISKIDMKVAGYDVYVFDPSSYTQCIFSDGTNSNKTGDLTIENYKFYYNGGCSFNHMFLRGTMNSWNANEMTAISANVWVLPYHADETNDESFVFITSGSDWNGTKYAGGVNFTINTTSAISQNGDDASVHLESGKNYFFIFDYRESTKYAEIAEIYTVTYNANGGTGDVPTDGEVYYHDYKCPIAKSTPIPTAPDGYYFGGWNTANNGTGHNYAVGDVVNESASTNILYANWQAYRHVTYDANGGTGTAPIDDTDYEEGQSATVEGSGTLKKVGYRFTGWNTVAEGGGDSYAEGDALEIGASSVTLYAQWEEGREYHASFHNGAVWSPTVYAYTWTDEVHQLGSYPGTASPYDEGSGLHHIYFFTNTKPAKIQWNGNANDKKTEDLDFGNNMEYDNSNKISHKISLTAGVWASFCPSLDVTVPDGVTVYKGAVSGSNVILTPVVTTKIMAGEGVILKAASDMAAAEFVKTTDAAAISENSLSGTDVRIPRNTTKVTYALYDDGGTQIFKKYEGDYIPANRAYFELSSPVGAPAAFRLVDGENGATNIEAIEDAEKAVKFVENGKLYILHEGVVYDATGRIVR